MVTILLVLLYCIFFAFHHNAYVRYKITDYGVANKHIQVKWNEMRSNKICEVTLGKYDLLHTVRFTPIICFGRITNLPWWCQNSKSCVWLPLTEENVNIIQKQCEAQNIDIDLTAWSFI